ncbi:hypothetical protein FRC10_004985 [Ceratobasidium sp. 414]|nr:hypothetical protein FRC10_004985 [Ceratobasidium sp. 414]
MATVTLISSDNEQFTVGWDVFRMMGVFAPQDGRIDSTPPGEDIDADSTQSPRIMRLGTISSTKRVVFRIEKESGNSIDNPRRQVSEIGEWDQKFIQVDQEMLFEIILAANYLDIKGLLDVGCKTVADTIKGKTPAEIRRHFNIVNDYTPEEEAQIKRENEWAEDI